LPHSIILQNDGKGFLLNDGKFILLNAEGPEHPAGVGGRVRRKVGPSLTQGDLGPRPTIATTGESIHKTALTFRAKSKSKLRIITKVLSEAIFPHLLTGASFSKTALTIRNESRAVPYCVSGESFGILHPSIAMEKLNQNNIKLAKINHYYKVLDEIDRIYPDVTTLGFEFNETTHNEQLIAFTHSSSFIGNVRYNTETGEMRILLNGKAYNFCNISRRLFDSFEGANSKGAFFAREIKGLHDC